MFKQVLEKVSPEYDDKIKMYKVDIEEETDMAVLFGARALPYMVFISKDGEVSGTTGAMNEDQIKYYFDGLISK